MASEFKINKAYAEKYDIWRAKEELQKLKSKYGDEDIERLEESSSSSESEDEDAEALTAQVEKDWLKTLAALRSKNPKIYKKDAKFYHSDEDSDDKKQHEKERKKNKQKPVFLKDYERKIIVEKDGQLSSDSDENISDDEDAKNKLGYYEEQEEIRKSFKEAISKSDDESSDTEFLSKRKKTKEEEAEEEEDYLNWLKGQKSELSEDKQAGIQLEPLKDYWGNPSLDSGEKFLRDYILNKGYLDKDTDRIPTYHEVVDEDDYSDEEQTLVKQEEFERKYNFRFEEPDPEFIKSYPRTIENSVRRKDSSRAQKRLEIRERKKMEKEVKKEEIKQLKNLKKKEILDKIEKLKQITGNPSLAFDDDDLNDDFDPKKHDEMMSKYFDEQYYGEEEDQKPDVGFEDEDLETENWDTWEGAAGGDDFVDEDDMGPHADDEDFNMDADYDPSQSVSKKKKKKSKFAKAVLKSKAVFDPEEKTFEQYLDEYYQLDCEDVIGDMPCRFKYRQVTPNNYGLGVDEILKCRDKELNAWVSLKKMSQYRTEEEEAADVKIYSHKGHNSRKKLNILPSLRQDEEKSKEEATSSTTIGEKKKKKREKKKKKKLANSSSNVVPSETIIKETKTTSGKRKSEIDYSGPAKKAKLRPNCTDNLSKKEKLGKKKGMNKVMVPDKVSYGVSKPESSVKETKIESVKMADGDSKDKSSDSGGNANIICRKEEEKGSVKLENVTNSEKKTKKKKKKKKSAVDSVSSDRLTAGDGQKGKHPSASGKIKKPAVTDERLLAYGINPKKFKFMKLKKLQYDDDSVSQK